MEEEGTIYKLRSKKRFFFTIILFFLFILVGFLLFSGKLFFVVDFVKGALQSDEAFSGRKYILLLGTDAREGEEIYRTDTIILAGIDTTQNKLALLSIPRDTWVEIPQHGWDKINCAVFYGGPELSADIVSDLVGVKVEDYILTDYNGFKNIIDILGGVTIDIKNEMYHYDPADGGIYTIDLKPGVQVLDGEKALQYVRYRSYVMGDIERTEYQQKFLKALIDESIQAGTILKLPQLLSEMKESIITNLSWSEILSLANVARKVEGVNIVSETLPGDFWDYQGISYWKVNETEVDLLKNSLFEENEN